MGVASVGSVPWGCRGRGNEYEGKEGDRLTGTWKNRARSRGCVTVERWLPPPVDTVLWR